MSVEQHSCSLVRARARARTFDLLLTVKEVRSVVVVRSAQRDMRLSSLCRPQAPPRLALQRTLVAHATAPRIYTTPSQVHTGPGEVEAQLQLRTGDDAKDALSEPLSPLFIALHSEDGRAFLATDIPPRGEGGPVALRGQRGGRRVPLGQQSSAAQKHFMRTKRFDAERSDTLTLLLPDWLGKPVSIWASPQVGSWRVEAVRAFGGVGQTER